MKGMIFVDIVFSFFFPKKPSTFEIEQVKDNCSSLINENGWLMHEDSNIIFYWIERNTQVW